MLARFYREKNIEYTYDGIPEFDYNVLKRNDTRNSSEFYPCENIDDPYYMSKESVKELQENFNGVLRHEISKAMTKYAEDIILKEFLAFIHDSITGKTDKLYDALYKMTGLPKDDISEDAIYDWLEDTVTKYYKAYPEKLKNAVVDKDTQSEIIEDTLDSLYENNDDISYFVDMILKLYRGGSDNPSCAEVGDLVRFFEYPNTFVKPNDLELEIDNVMRKINWDDAFTDIILYPEYYNIHVPTADELLYYNRYKDANRIIKEDARINR